MFALGLFDSILPAYSVVAFALVLLMGAAIVVASRVLAARQVTCPENGHPTDIVVETQKRWPWSQVPQSSVAQCSRLPHGVTCEQPCMRRAPRDGPLA